MTVLAPMRPEIYPSYLEPSIVGFAEECVIAGRWPEEGAVERSRDVFQSLLPRGVATPDNHLFEILAGEGGPTVGFLWLAIVERHGVRSAYVYDIVIHEAYRRRGHAKRALLALEPIVAALGFSSIGLHVFAHNPGAQALYRQIGYAVAGVNMLKRLGTR